MKQLRVLLARRVHYSRFVFATFFGVLLGIAAARLGTAVSVWWCVLAVASLLVAHRQRTVLYCLVCASAGLTIGMWRGGVLMASLAGYQPLVGTEVVVEGVVMEDPAIKGDQQRLIVGTIRIGGRDYPGSVWMNVDGDQDVRRSDRISVSGRLEAGFGAVAATMTQGKVEQVSRSNGDIALRVRDRFAAAVRSVVRSPESELGLGFLTGQRNQLPESVEQNLRTLGLTHIIVASGYNLTILVRLARGMFNRLSRYSALIGSLALVLGFLLVTGFNPSMVRASLVATLSLLAWFYGRTVKPLMLLVVSAAISAFISPSYVWGDLGWYLSFLAFAGVIVVGPLARSYFFGDKPKAHYWRDLIIETSAAQLLTLPLLLYVFGTVSPLVLLANIAVLPVIPHAMLAVFGAGVLHSLLPISDAVAGLPATIIVGYIVKLTDWLAQTPWSNATISLSRNSMIVIYALIALSAWHMYRRSSQSYDKNYIE